MSCVSSHEVKEYCVVLLHLVVVDVVVVVIHNEYGCCYKVDKNDLM